ncbi:MAG: restriction endonuclease subunit S [Rhodospirillales bacterium]|nr:restriction endonuclease subunit S [Rhodospirillales bacterium]MDE2575820.1 restriction endonuclease subunit S [Rhodospirillales bacterium]
MGVFDCPHSTPSLVASGPLVVRSQDIRGGVFRLHEAACVTEETYQERIARAEPRFGDLLYSREGTYFGIAAEVPPNVRVCLGQRMVLIRPDPTQINARFLRFWLNSHTLSSHLYGFRDGTVAERLNMPTIRGLPVPSFLRADQDAIASILGALDDKIELNRRMSATLEAMARAIFKDWFVDFGPTRAKQEGRQPYLAPEIWSLFPARLDDDDKPEGWEIRALVDVATLNPESWSRANYPEHVEYVDLSNTKWGSIESTERHGRASAPSRAQRILRSGDTIVGTVRPGNGSFAMVSQHGLTGSTGFAALRPKAPTYREYLYLAATSPSNIDRLSHLADGGAYPAVRPEVVSATQIVLSGSAPIEAFHQTTAPLIDRMEANRQENMTLAATRDLLLPKLMSGELRVRDAEAALADTPV